MLIFRKSRITPPLKLMMEPLRTTVMFTIAGPEPRLLSARRA